MQNIISASSANSIVRFRAACGPNGTLSERKTSCASGVSGAPTLAETPALAARTFTVSNSSIGIPIREAISAFAIAAAIGERQVFPLHTNRNKRCRAMAGSTKVGLTLDHRSLKEANALRSLAQ